jgi:hypothetical protein
MNFLKLIRKMKLNFLSISLLALLLTACSLSESKKDNQIDPRIKNEIHALNKKIVNGLVENKIQTILPICNERLRNRKEEIQRLMQLLKGTIKKSDFRILNEYYQKNAAKKGVATLSSGKGNMHDYQIRYDSRNKEMYVVVAYFRDSLYQKSFTFFYGKHNNEWKLTNLQAGALKIVHKDAVDWYLQAKSEYQQGDLMDAMCHIGLATQILNPVNHMWKYAKEKEIQSFEQKVTKETYSKYNFPHTVNYVETKPVIYRVYSQIMPEGCLPLVLYTTSIDLKNVPALAAECKAMHDKIGDLFKGIDINNKIIIYRPQKHIPNGTETDNKYVFMMKNK